MILRLVVLCLAGGGAYVLLGGRPESLPALVRSCLAVLLLVGGLGWWSAKRGKDEVPVAKGARKPGWRDFLAMGMGILAIECGFLWLLSVAPAPLEEVAILIEERFQPAAAKERADTGAPRNTGNWLWSDEGRRQLPRRTNLKPGIKPEVFVRIPDPKDAGRLLKRKVYVRAFVLDDFKDGAWSLGRGRAQDLEADGSGWIGLGETDGTEILHEVFHGKDTGGRNVLTALQGVRAVRLPSLHVAADGMSLLPESSGPTGYQYLAASAPMSLEDLDRTKDWGRGDPVKTGDRFGVLTSKAAGRGDVLGRLLNIQAFLRDGYGYSLVTENHGNLDPLENFLFGEKRGHCEFFATAGALMARELGVQSRVAYGWVGGEFFADSRTFVFRAREAHAWVEVKMPGHGWVVMEPTPPVVLGGGGEPRLAGSGETLPSSEEALAEEEEAFAGNSHVGDFALGLMAVFGVMAIAALFIRGMSKSDDDAVDSGLRGAKKRRGYFGLWESAYKRKSTKRRNGLTLRMQLDGLDEAPPFGDELRTYHYAVRYEESPPDAERERRLVDHIRSWE